MPTMKKGNMWSVFEQIDHFVFTTNSTLRSNGELVMGAGIAKQVRNMFPQLPRDLGAIVKGRTASGGVYGLIMAGRFGLLQTKRNWWEDSDPQLVLHSVNVLAKYAQENADKTFAVNYPGIGKGNLTIEQVAPIVAMLPSNVQVWTFAHESSTDNSHPNRPIIQESLNERTNSHATGGSPNYQ